MQRGQAQRSGWLETGALMTLRGDDVVIAGVIKSSLATPATYDDEVLIEAKRDVALGGSFTLAGSLSVTAGRDISAPTLSLMASAAGQHLLLGAGGNIDLGTTNGTGGVVMAADTLLTLSATGRLIAIDDWPSAGLVLNYNA